MAGAPVFKIGQFDLSKIREITFWFKILKSGKQIFSIQFSSQHCNVQTLTVYNYLSVCDRGKMFIEPKILKHEQTTELVHTLEINGETYEKTSEIKSKIIHDHPKSRKSLFSLTLRHNSKPNVTFKETRINGKVKDTKHETTLKKNEFNSFIQRYFIAWKPRYWKFSFQDCRRTFRVFGARGRLWRGFGEDGEGRYRWL